MPGMRGGTPRSDPDLEESGNEHFALLHVLQVRWAKETNILPLFEPSSQVEED